MSTVSEADRQAAHEALLEKPITCDDLRPGIRHDWICEDVAQAIAAAREAGERAGAELMIAKPGTIVGRYQLCRKDVQNECFGWWVVETTDGRRPCPQGFISLPNLIAARGRP